MLPWLDRSLLLILYNLAFIPTGLLNIGQTGKPNSNSDNFNGKFTHDLFILANYLVIRHHEPMVGAIHQFKILTFYS